MTRRFWIALALSLPVVVLEMGGHVVELGQGPVSPLRRRGRHARQHGPEWPDLGPTEAVRRATRMDKVWW